MILQRAGPVLGVLAGRDGRTGHRQDGVCDQTEAVSIHSNALWTLQRPGNLRKIDGTRLERPELEGLSHLPGRYYRVRCRFLPSFRSAEDGLEMYPGGEFEVETDQVLPYEGPSSISRAHSES